MPEEWPVADGRGAGHHGRIARDAQVRALGIPEVPLLSKGCRRAPSMGLSVFVHAGPCLVHSS